MKLRTTFIFLLLITTVSAKEYFYQQNILDVLIQPNSDLLMNETYVMNFQDEFTYGYRSFIMRNLGDIVDFKVSGPTGPYEIYKSGYENDQKVFYWHMYANHEIVPIYMTYTIVGAIHSKKDYDLLYYTVVPGEREKVVQEFVATFNFPADIDASQLSINITHGSYEQTGPRTIKFTAGPILPNTPMDVEFQLPKGMVQIPINWGPIFGYIYWALVSLAIFGLGLYALYSFYSEWRKHGRDPEVDQISDEKLENLKPAIAGIVVDESADIKEIISTIIDLAIRGYIYIQEEKKPLFGKDITLVELERDYSNLEEYEKMVMQKLFRKGNEVKVSSFKDEFYKFIPPITDKMEKCALQIGLFDEEPEKVRNKYLGQFIIPSIIVIALSFFVAFSSFGLIFIGALDVMPLLIGTGINGAFFGFFLIFASLAVAHYMPRKSVKGVYLSKKYINLKSWMEKYPLKEQRIFDEFLPYAIAFGIGDVWVKKMQALQQEVRTTWYSGSLTTSSFNSMYSSMSSSMASSPSSSGGSGGGGFGGGGGAGGGGSGFG